MEVDALNGFKEAMQSRGLVPPTQIIADGKIHRCDADKKNGKNDGAYCLHDDGMPAGWLTNHTDGRGAEAWSAKGKRRELTTAEKAQIEANKRQRQVEQEEKQRSVARGVQQKLDALAVTGASDYLMRKKVRGYDGVRYGDGYIMIPICDSDGTIWNSQTIYDDQAIPEKLKAQGRNKHFPYGGRKKGLFFVIGSLANANAAYVAEGYATAATIHEATGLPVIVAFDAGNLAPVIEAVQSRFPDLALTVAGDGDQWKPEAGNTGRLKAEEAGKQYGCTVVFPEFGDILKKNKPTDFNDLHVLAGLEEVTRQLLETEKTKETDAEVITRLAGLPPLDYARQAKEAARAMGVTKTDLDKAVKEYKAQQHRQSAGSSELFPPVDPWPEPVTANVLLDELTTTFKRFAILPDHADTALALWVTFSWLIDAVNIAPILAITSPEKQCGKTTVLSLVGSLVARPLPTSNITPAAMFRAIERWQPTMLIDEADTFIREAEELRGVLNSGHTRPTAFVIRTVGDTHEPTKFTTWGAKAIALIGKLPETLHDRSVVIALRRKLPGETTEKLRYSAHGVFEPLRQKLQRFADDNREAIRVARPNLPQGISHRAQDNWEPLLAIAGLAGDEWLLKAETAATVLSATEQGANSIGAELLEDIHHIFELRNIDRISSKDLIEALCDDDERPWLTYNRGKQIAPRQIARFLDEYGIKSKNIKFGTTPLKGYELDQFTDAFERYLFFFTTPGK